jgi:hypothetical protein
MRVGLSLAGVAVLASTSACSLGDRAGDTAVDRTRAESRVSVDGDEDRLIADVTNRAGISPGEAEVFLADQDRFGEIVGQMRARFPEQFADSEVLWSPKPGFAVTFVDGVPAEARELVTGLSYYVALHGDGRASEASLEQLRNRIWHLLNAQGVTRESTGVDPVRGVVEVVVPPGFEPESDTLRGLLEDPRVQLTEQHLADDGYE